MSQLIRTGKVLVPTTDFVADTWGAVSGVAVRNKSLNALSTVPAWATCAVFRLEIGSTATTYGWQYSGDTAFKTNASAARVDFLVYLPINVAKTVDLFLGSTVNGKWYLEAYTDHINFLATPYDISSVLTNANTFTPNVSPTVPNGAASGSLLLEISRSALKFARNTIPVGQIQYAVLPRQQIVIPLNSDMTFKVNTTVGTAAPAGTMVVLGWSAQGAFTHEEVEATLNSPYTIATTNTYTQLGKVTNTVLDDWRTSSLATTSSIGGNITIGTRPYQDSNYTTTTANTLSNYRWTSPDSAGRVEGFTNTPANGQFRWYGGWVADTTYAYITAISGFVAGTTATITLSKAVTTFDTLIIKGSDSHVYNLTGMVYTGSGNQWTVTIPSPVNGSDGIRFGVLTLTPVTNTNQTGADYTSASYTRAGYNFVNIEDVLAGNVCEGDSPALVSGDQISYDSTTGATVDVHGIYNDVNVPQYIGTQTMWHYAADFKWYSFTWTTTDTTPTPSGGGLNKLIAVGFGIGISI